MWVSRGRAPGALGHGTHSEWAGASRGVPGASARFERETKREKNLETRAKELKLKAKKEQGNKGDEESDEKKAAVIKEVEERFFAETKKPEGEDEDANGDVNGDAE